MSVIAICFTALMIPRFSFSFSTTKSQTFTLSLCECVKLNAMHSFSHMQCKRECAREKTQRLDNFGTT